MKKKKKFSATDGYKCTHNFSFSFRVKQHDLIKSFSTDYKDYFYQKKRRQMEDTEN